MPEDMHFREVVGARIGIPPDRPDLLLIELRTPQGVQRFSMPKNVAVDVGDNITKAAQNLAPAKPRN